MRTYWTLPLCIWLWGVKASTNLASLSSDAKHRSKHFHFGTSNTHWAPLSSPIVDDSLKNFESRYYEGQATPIGSLLGSSQVGRPENLGNQNNFAKLAREPFRSGQDMSISSQSIVHMSVPLASPTRPESIQVALPGKIRAPPKTPLRTDDTQELDTFGGDDTPRSGFKPKSKSTPTPTPALPRPLSSQHSLGVPIPIPPEITFGKYTVVGMAIEPYEKVVYGRSTSLYFCMNQYRMVFIDGIADQMTVDPMKMLETPDLLQLLGNEEELRSHFHIKQGGIIVELFLNKKGQGKLLVVPLGNSHASLVIERPKFGSVEPCESVGNIKMYSVTPGDLVFLASESMIRSFKNAKPQGNAESIFDRMFLSAGKGNIAIAIILNRTGPKLASPSQSPALLRQYSPKPIIPSQVPTYPGNYPSNQRETYLDRPLRTESPPPEANSYIYISDDEAEKISDEIVREDNGALISRKIMALRASLSLAPSPAAQVPHLLELRAPEAYSPRQYKYKNPQVSADPKNEIWFTRRVREPKYFIDDWIPDGSRGLLFAQRMIYGDGSYTRFRPFQFANRRVGFQLDHERLLFLDGLGLEREHALEQDEDIRRRKSLWLGAPTLGALGDQDALRAQGYPLEQFGLVISLTDGDSGRLLAFHTIGKMRTRGVLLRRKDSYYRAMMISEVGLKTHEVQEGDIVVIVAPRAVDLIPKLLHETLSPEEVVVMMSSVCSPVHPVIAAVVRYVRD
jgi:hypothetical protein